MFLKVSRNWWLILAAAIAAFEVLTGINEFSLVREGNEGSIAGGVFFGTAAAVIVVGIFLRSRARIAGDALVIIGSVPALALLWMVLPPIAGLVVIIAAAFDVAEARNLRSYKTGGSGSEPSHPPARSA